MPEEISVRLDPDDQARLIADVNAFDREQGKALAKRIRGIIIPVGRQMVRDVVPAIPRRGGLAARIARTRPGASVRGKETARTGAGASLIFRKPRVLRYIDKGQFPHPVFADAKERRSAWTWTRQSIRSRLLTDAFEKDAGQQAKRAVEDAVVDALNTIRAGTVHR